MADNMDHLTIDAAAKILGGVHRRTVFRYIRQGLLASFKHAGRTYIHRVEIENYFARLQMDGDKRRAAMAKQANRKSAA